MQDSHLLYSDNKSTAFIIFYALAWRTGAPHKRHSFATHLMNDDVELINILRLMGHSNIKTTSIYLHVKDYQILNIKSPLDTFE